jgi:nitroimidazol reductase NimA-like FMN-containing flavoprotein (pyridoxamine 5'-phosphate oxidase superfamily)
LTFEEDVMRPVRRTDREISTEAATELLERGEYGVLSSVGPDAQPYGVPLSYAYRDGRIYFHCALSGHKLDNLQDNPKVSFCVVGATQVLPEKFSTNYESAIAFGTAAEVRGIEREQAYLLLLQKYCPELLTEGRRYLEQKGDLTRVYRIDVSQVSGKARR